MNTDTPTPRSDRILKIAGTLKDSVLSEIRELEANLAAVTKERDEAKAMLVISKKNEAVCQCGEWASAHRMGGCEHSFVPMVEECPNAEPLFKANKDLAALRAELAEAKQAYETHLDGAVKLRAERDQLRAENERLRTGRDRLIEELDRQRGYWQAVLPDGLAHKAITKIDAAIDAAAGFKPSNDGQGQSLRNP